MAVKTVSTRVGIIGRGAKCVGRSAVERSAYISRTTIHSDYYAETFYPKYAEDLVHSEVLLPPQAPREYADRAVLWNSVEAVEKHAKAQLARSINFTLPNSWSYEFAKEFTRDFIQREFVDKGMCFDFAIHDSVNEKTGERNLHAHGLGTMRPINEDGTWGDKSRKVYKLDKDGNKIRKKNGRYDCTTEKTTDWDRPEFAREFREHLVQAINEANERLGIQDEVWEHRSFKERGLEQKPTIHLGEKASALERQGIHTKRGDYNREVMYLNSLIIKVQEIKRERIDKLVGGVKETATATVKAVKNEVLELIHKTAAKKKFMSLPVVKSKYLAKISNREVLSNPQLSEDFVKNYGIETFEQLQEYIEKHSKTADDMDTVIKGKWQRIQDLKELAEVYAEYSRLRDVAKESRKQSIFTKKKFDKEHEVELSDFDYYDARLSEIKGDAKATPKAWAKEIESLEKELPPLQTEYGREISRIATAEVIEYTKKDMERIEANERRAVERQQPQRKKQQELS